MFGQLSRRIFDDKLELTIGGRYFHDDVSSIENGDSTGAVPGYRAENEFSATTPRAVLTWYPNTDLTVYGSYSEGFRSGAPQPFYVTGGEPGFPAVKPDKLDNYEVGTKADLFDHRVSVDVSFYYMVWKTCNN
jgi:iron complex outermembrane receptor protein